MFRSLLTLLFLLLLFSSCWRKIDPYERPAKKVLGYKPVYSTDSALLRVIAEPARSIKNAGKIYAYGNYILQTETGEGVHVLDKTIPTQLANLGFLRIKGNSEVSIKGKFLYANSYTDLVVVDIEDWQQPVEVKKLRNVFKYGVNVPGFYHFIPLPEHGVYYDCMGVQQGFQTGWVKDSIYDNNCYYN